MIILSAKNLTKSFGKKIALSNVNVEIPRGRIIGLLGPNGSGKSTFLKLATGLLVPTEGEITIDGAIPGVETKAKTSYLAERTYLNGWMRAEDIIAFFEDFYEDFNRIKAENMLKELNINPSDRLKTMSKGTKEKVQLILIMSRSAELYLLDEPIGGVDPAARDYILNTIITNYKENASVIISTHLIADIEQVLDDIVFISKGEITMTSTVDEIREKYNKSVDGLFREVFKC
ncbi:ATP-binding cassette domain-containing protein [Acetobacterium paludosum]|uniref:ATP-binding cassette domain-containing protein n=2 Tax=Acetobacterium TaxID=33951 RepID=A0A923I291_9FIRM|nr:MULTISPECIES: ABC transporter ATP-binding protein [Acetobacterium]MBC3795595.1 ATP-binding cassette domain-containing protein [Acetobacterium tundrae]MBC3887760.1 ATP-binding cassette domain-containing protein [Acetobacterium paludosum]